MMGPWRKGWPGAQRAEPESDLAPTLPGPSVEKNGAWDQGHRSPTHRAVDVLGPRALTACHLCALLYAQQTFAEPILPAGQCSSPLNKTKASNAEVPVLVVLALWWREAAFAGTMNRSGP